MRRRMVLAAVAGLLVAGINGGSMAGGSPTRSNRAAGVMGRAVGATPVVTGLNYPAAFTFAPDGRIFYGERLTGKIRIYDPSNGSNTLFFTITNVSHIGEQGLLGLAIHPRYPARPLVYAYATRSVNGS